MSVCIAFTGNRLADYSKDVFGCTWLLKLLAYILHRKGFINIGHVYLVPFAFSGEERWIQFASQILAMHHCDRNVRSSVFTKIVIGTFTEKDIDFFLEQILLLIGDLRKHDFSNDPVSAEKVRAFAHSMYEAGIGLMIFRTRCAGLSKEEIRAEIGTVGSSREYVNRFTPESLDMQLDSNGRTGMINAVE